MRAAATASRSVAAALAMLAGGAAGAEEGSGDAAAASAGATLDGPVWVLERLDGEPYPAEARVIFTTDAEGGALVRGGGPCNTFRGIYVVETPAGGLFDAGPFAATRRACPELAAEQAFLAALDAASEAEVGPERLVLGGFGPVMEFRAAPPAPGEAGGSDAAD